MADLSGLKQRVRRRTQRVHARGMRDIEGQLESKVPRKQGKLAGSKRTSLAGGGSTLRGAISYPLDYASYTDTGRGPVVARGRALRFVVGGRVIFRKRVGPARGTQWWSKTSTARAGARR